SEGCSMNAPIDNSQQGWQPGQFSVLTEEGEHPVAGWISEPFALDFRVWEDENDWFRSGWALTHLPTGYIAAGILAPLSQAFVIADEFRAAADWDFTAPDEAKARKGAVADLRKKHGGVLVNRQPLFSPFSIWGQGE